MEHTLTVCVAAALLAVTGVAQMGMAQTGVAQSTAGRKAAAKSPAKQGASTAARAPEKFPVTSIVIQGKTTFPPEQVIAASGLKIGEPADKPRFEIARKQLEATGMFDSVGYQFEPAENGKGYVATFNVDEVSPMYTVQFEGLNAASSEIHKYLKSKEVLYNGKLPPTTFIIDRFTREIETYLASINHPEKIVTKVVPSGPASFDLVFRTGAPLPVIAEVTFEGNKAVLITDLEHAINDVAYGVPYSEYTFKELLDNQIKPLYEAKGYLGVKFLNVTTEPSPKVKGVIVHLTVDEGPVYKLNRSGVSGVPREQGADLLKLAKFKTGEIANFDEINQGVERMKKSLQHDGYIHAETDIAKKLNNAEKSVDILVKLTPGPQYHYGKLVIKGLDLDGEAAIQKLWAPKPGKPYNAEYPDYFLQRVKEQGLFDNLGDTKALKNVDEESHVVDITLDFKLAPAKKERPRETQPGSPF